MNRIHMISSDQFSQGKIEKFCCKQDTYTKIKTHIVRYQDDGGKSYITVNHTDSRQLIHSCN
jgi:hypothetical protein